ncbi:hypothetical protein DIPPA_22529 [Diplonema papillatum]|nr:hypothetical protein DIPPA_22550 [Diplonema papillatum]KAJ9462974.1 hypothetical protein DIPPA_22535 [Diplonema papillatum]KAJ9462975.1 hypothetical protein DIPPA_22529 [Diplonema papillatum]
MAEERQPLRPVFDPPASEERADARALVAALQLRAHPEGGYYAETYASALTIPSPYPAAPACSGGGPAAEQRAGFDVALRRAATAIFYYLTPARPTGVFHRNRSPRRGSHLANASHRSAF